MIDITDKAYKPDLNEIVEFVDNPLFLTINQELTDEFNAKTEVMYSGDKQLLGWNVKYFKGGRTLCRLYPRNGYFSVLIVVGKKEKERVETALEQMSEQMQQIYAATQEGMGQRWLIFDLSEQNGLYRDLIALVKIRRESK